ncbi:transcription antitermination factor NusB [Cytobacillus sp. FSL W7-1323]|uniref:Transcription antitermination protein NusB n=1 Tax=Cytobacillus kochii TaxID=859143 RepID=A0A248TLQ4_9BACI|nr:MULTISPECIES: transcription antitermination factor NusB [Cytobacillus]ASV69049.1 N utilization substance protein B [Cytobacillus kochii]MDQ0183783.1 N utilization substance protein B [Cytobacillus kochii]MEA1853046.1 transcription antitermination factor NusB [Cytobacillus sp. OWB-43]MED1604100.1 transcription antitermination factor NusB [Cytobacillus kochii]
MKRRTAREKALQALFQIDLSGTEMNEAIHHVLDEQREDAYLNHLVSGVLQHKAQIDELISNNLENWKLDRLATVDRNLLRLSTFEFAFSEDDIPVNVVINEAIEIAKMYGDDQSPKFINSVLSKIKDNYSEN